MNEASCRAAKHFAHFRQHWQ